MAPVSAATHLLNGRHELARVDTVAGGGGEQLVHRIHA